MPGIDLTPWKVETLEQIEVENYMSEPTKRPEELEELNDELIKAAVEKAKEDLIARRKFEYEAWLQRKCSTVSVHKEIESILRLLACNFEFKDFFIKIYNIF